MAVATGQKPGEPVAPADFEGPADALVVFGITGDLAKVMTFHSLYRLEARGLRNCPIIGVAGNDWSPDELRSNARSAIENTGERVDPDVFGRSRTASRMSKAISVIPERLAALRRQSPRRGPRCSTGCVMSS